MTQRELLTLSQASEILGVHPRTLRQWADQGHIVHVQTPGGHRRFPRREIEEFVRRMGEKAGGQSLAKAARSAIRAAITGEQPVRVSQTHPSPLPPELTPDQRSAMRVVGRKLVGLVIRYAAGDTDEEVLEQARELGAAYGRLCRGAGMSVTSTISTFNFFRNPIIDVTFEASAETAGLDRSKPQLYQRLDRFFNEVLLATVSAVERRGK